MAASRHRDDLEAVVKMAASRYLAYFAQTCSQNVSNARIDLLARETTFGGAKGYGTESPLKVVSVLDALLSSLPCTCPFVQHCLSPTVTTAFQLATRSTTERLCLWQRAHKTTSQASVRYFNTTFDYFYEHWSQQLDEVVLEALVLNSIRAKLEPTTKASLGHNPSAKPKDAVHSASHDTVPAVEPVGVAVQSTVDSVESEHRSADSLEQPSADDTAILESPVESHQSAADSIKIKSKGLQNQLSSQSASIRESASKPAHRSIPLPTATPNCTPQSKGDAILLHPVMQLDTNPSCYQWCLLSRCRAYNLQPQDAVAPLLAELLAQRQLASQSRNKLQEWRLIQEALPIQAQPETKPSRLGLQSLSSSDDAEWWSRRYSTTPEELPHGMSEGDDDSDHDVPAHLVDVPRALQTRGGRRRKRMSTLPERRDSGSESETEHNDSTGSSHAGSDSDESSGSGI